VVRKKGQKDTEGGKKEARLVSFKKGGGVTKGETKKEGRPSDGGDFLNDGKVESRREELGKESEPYLTRKPETGEKS